MFAECAAFRHEKEILCEIQQMYTLGKTSMQICFLNLQDLLILCLFVAFLSDINSFCVFQGYE